MPRDQHPPTKTNSPSSTYTSTYPPRSEQRAISDLVPLMSPTKAEYVFGSVPDVVSSIIRRLLPDIKVRGGL